MNKLKRLLKALFDSLKKTVYLHYYKRKSLKENLIFIESKNGNDLAGNMYGILKEVTGPDYSDFVVILSVAGKASQVIKSRVGKSGIKNVKYARKWTGSYFAALTEAKYIFADTALPGCFMKKEGQIITNTWHGTPLKAMGVHVPKGYKDLGDVISTFSITDYLVFPNDFMKEKMMAAYELDEIYKGQILLEGYPRNSIFLSEKKDNQIRRELGLEGKQVIVYMATWREATGGKSAQEQTDEMFEMLKDLDGKLGDNQYFYVKLHPLMAGKLNLSQLKHILPYPGQYDVYEFLQESDILVTDYSSVFFDFANTGKKVILFPYDQKDYQESRGLYFPLSDLPFPIVVNTDELVKEIASPKLYDDSEFIKKFCTYDCPDAAGKICRQVIRREMVCKSIPNTGNGKENVLIYMIDFAKNGITTALYNLLSEIDLSEKNYFLAFDSALTDSSPIADALYAKGVVLWPISLKKTMTLGELLCWQFYKRFSWAQKMFRDKMKRYFSREAETLFGKNLFRQYIHFSGYDVMSINLVMNACGPRTIFAHNDMVEETARKKNLSRGIIEQAYQMFDQIAVVTEDLIPATLSLCKNRDKIKVVSNILNYKEIQKKALKEMSFDADTVCNYPLDRVKAMLLGDEPCILTCGRFSWEKNHFELIEAFERFYKNHPQYRLFIIGGYGPLFDETMKRARESEAQIIVIKSVSNPYPFMKAADLFILPSKYEGLGLTLLEADTLLVPTVATRVCGPMGFVTKNNGCLVEANAEGIYNAMLDFHQKGGIIMNVDYDYYNNEACREFSKLLQNGDC